MWYNSKFCDLSVLLVILSLGNNNRNRASERYHIPHKKAVKDHQQQQQQRQEEDKENFATPLETPIRRQRSRKGDNMVTPVLSPSKSMDSGMNELSVTPKGSIFATPSRPPLHGSNAGGGSGPVTPKSSKKVFGSIERGLDKMKNMLTPRRGRTNRDVVYKIN